MESKKKLGGEAKHLSEQSILHHKICYVELIMPLDILA